ncbi:MAG: queuosine precursor transporter [Opitutaceae bacterium]|nr:queuosine precursor transporter [Opitutaceae bacterium]
MKHYRHFSTITALFTATLLISNTLDNKVFKLGSLDLPAGIILFPLAYLFGDVLTEVYGYAASRKVIWTGFASLLLMVLTYEIARVLPAASFWSYQEAYNAILGRVPRIVAASMTAYFAGEFCNSYVLAKVKVKMMGKAMSVRFVLSTIVGEFVDTTVFVLIAFTGAFPMAELVSVTLSAWAVKVGWEIIALPLTLPVVRYLKRAESEDYYDIDTNFNPFSFHSSSKRASTPVAEGQSV